MNKAFVEQLYQDFYYQSIAIHHPIVEKSTQFQELKIFQNNFFGKVLSLDGVVQTTERDEFFYHEMIAHVPMMFHDNPRRVLIIGGGDGGVLREVLKHCDVERAVMIEIDEEVVAECSEHMPLLNDGAFKNEKADIRFIDGIEFVRQTTDKFDIIIVDSTDPMGVGEPLFTNEFYNNCAARLTSNGILVTQSGVPFYQAQELGNTRFRLNSAFDIVMFYVVPVPTYVGGFMSLSFATNSQKYVPNTMKLQNDRFSDLGKLKYYNLDIHKACFALPNYIKESI